MIKKPYFSLVLACYNEGPTFKKSLEKIFEVLSETKYSYEVICIDDKSVDNTLKILKKFVRSKKNWKVYANRNNKGRGATVKQGIRKSKGQIVGYIDVDLEVSAIYMNDFIRQVKKGSDVVIATRVYKIAMSNLLRSIATATYAYLSRMVLNHNLKDTEAGYKFFLRKSILPILNKCENNHWFFDTEILVRSRQSGLKIKQVPVLFLKRKNKKSTVKLIPDTIKYLIALNEFKKKL